MTLRKHSLRARRTPTSEPARDAGTVSPRAVPALTRRQRSSPQTASGGSSQLQRALAGLSFDDRIALATAHVRAGAVSVFLFLPMSLTFLGMGLFVVSAVYGGLAIAGAILCLEASARRARAERQEMDFNRAEAAMLAGIAQLKRAVAEAVAA